MAGEVASSINQRRQYAGKSHQKKFRPKTAQISPSSRRLGVVQRSQYPPVTQYRRSKATLVRRDRRRVRGESFQIGNNVEISQRSHPTLVPTTWPVRCVSRDPESNAEVPGRSPVASGRQGADFVVRVDVPGPRRLKFRGKSRRCAPVQCSTHPPGTRYRCPSIIVTGGVVFGPFGDAPKVLGLLEVAFPTTFPAATRSFTHPTHPSEVTFRSPLPMRTREDDRTVRQVQK